MGNARGRTLVRTTTDDEEEDRSSGSNENDGILRDNNNSISRHRSNNALSSNMNTISNVPSLVCAFSASATTGGTSYAFGIYASALKHDLGLSQSQLDSISTAFFVAGLFSFIPGYASDKFGTRFAILNGGLSMCTSLLLYWVVARQFVFVPHEYMVTMLSILGIWIFLSCALVTAGVFKSIVAATGPGTKGSAVGAAKGYVGLGAGLYACLFAAIQSYSESDLDFLPMAAFFAIVCSTIPSYFLLPTPKQLESVTFRDDATAQHFSTLFMALVVMATLVILNSMFNLYETASAEAIKQQQDLYVTVDDNNSTSVIRNETEEEQALLLSAATKAVGSKSNYLIALLYVVVWLGPIFGLLYLPRKSSSLHDHRALSTTDDDTNDVLGGNGRYEDNVALDEDEVSDHVEMNDSSICNTGNTNPCQQRPNLLRAGGSGDDENDDDEDNECCGGNSIVDASRSNSSDDDDNNGDTTATTTATTDMNLVQMLRTPSALLMLWTTIILVGAGTVETTNMGQMVESLGFPSAVTPAALALFSVAQAAGRVATGSFSEAGLNWNTRRFGINKGVPRPFFLVLASIMGFVSHFILGVATSEGVFVIGATMAGAAFGMVWPLMVLIIGEVFGTANVGANYMFFDGFTSAAGTLLLTKIIAQDVYESHIQDNAAGGTSGATSDAMTCIGTGCYQDTHMIVAGLSLTCIATSVGMMYTSRHVYNNNN